MSCFDKNNKHIGKLETLDKFTINWDAEAVVRWCPRCGAVVIDKEYDGRIMGKYSEMQFPEITRKGLRNG